MRVLYIAQYTSSAFRAAHADHGTSGFGGLRKMELVCEALCRAGHEVLLLSSAVLGVSRWRIRGAHEESLQCGGRRVRVVYPAALELKPLGGLLNALRARRIADRVVADFAPDVVLVYNSYLFEYLALRGTIARTRLPVFLEVEDLPLARRREWANLKPMLDQRCWAPLVARSAGFTAVNATIQGMLPADRPRTLLPGIVDDRLRALAATRDPPFTRDTRTLGYFGGLTADKGVGVLLDVLPALPEGWRIVVCGSGPLAPRFAAAEAEFPDRLRFRGAVGVEELYAQMCACDATLVPPERIEGDGTAVFPFKVFEYLVAGTHIIAPPLRPLQGSPVEFIQRWDGTSAALPALLARATSDFAADAAPREAALGAVVGRYSVDGAGRLLDAVFAAGAGAARPGTP